MEYRIVKKEAFRVMGLSSPMSHNLEENFRNVPALWARAAEENLIQRLAPLMDPDMPGLLGISDCGREGEYRYFIAVATSAPLSPGLEEFVVPACTWAVFPGSGPMPQAVQELEQRIVTQWLPDSGCEYANAPDLEVYLSPDPQNASFEVWLPVLPKGK